jgi:hypothetical protein
LIALYSPMLLGEIWCIRANVYFDTSLFGHHSLSLSRAVTPGRSHESAHLSSVDQPENGQPYLLLVVIDFTRLSVSDVRLCPYLQLWARSCLVQTKESTSSTRDISFQVLCITEVGVRAPKMWGKSSKLESRASNENARPDVSVSVIRQ